MFAAVVAVADENAHRGGLGLFERAHGVMGFGNEEMKNRLKAFVRTQQITLWQPPEFDTRWPHQCRVDGQYLS